MTDVRLKGTATLEAVTMDWLLRADGTIDEREELATAVRVALGTDSMASSGDVLPDLDSTDRRGWWGDLEAREIWDGWPVGCKNWLLTRAKITGAGAMEGSTLERARRYTQMALQPFIDRHIASHVDVSVELVSRERIDVQVTIYRGPKDEIDLRFQLMWQEPSIDEG